MIESETLPASTSQPAALHMLPDDVDSPQFAEGLRLLKDTFADRTSFNHFVCDELARRGISPNGANVLKYGRWGQGVAVAADVRSWFAHVSRRLSARHANIPDICQQQFNALGEQFWALALDHVGKPLKDEPEDEEKPRFEIASKNDYQLNQALNLLKGLQIMQAK